MVSVLSRSLPNPYSGLLFSDELYITPKSSNVFNIKEVLCHYEILLFFLIKKLVMITLFMRFMSHVGFPIKPSFHYQNIYRRCCCGKEASPFWKYVKKLS